MQFLSWRSYLAQGNETTTANAFNIQLANRSSLVGQNVFDRAIKSLGNCFQELPANWAACMQKSTDIPYEFWHG